MKYDKHIHLFENKVIRLGSYGDPVAVPFDTWTEILKVAKGNLSYTHQWKTCDQRYKNICMASIFDVQCGECFTASVC